jgi:hypothetical protein
VSVQVPASADLRALLGSLRELGDEAYVTDLGDRATLSVRKWVPGEGQTEAAASELRLDVADRLKAAGVLAT